MENITLKNEMTSVKDYKYKNILHEDILWGRWNENAR